VLWVLLALVLASAAAADVARAGSVHVGKSESRDVHPIFRDRKGARNDLTVSLRRGRFVFVDAKARLNAGRGCRQATTTRC
jgi:hypothetical protein